MGASFGQGQAFHRAGRRGGGDADGRSDRRRPPAEADAGPRRARLLYPRLLAAAPALVQHRPEERHGVELQYLCSGAALTRVYEISAHACPPPPPSPLPGEGGASRTRMASLEAPWVPQALSSP